MTIDDLIKDCINELGLALNTVTSYRKGLRRFLAFLEEEKNIKPNADITLLNVDHFIAYPSWLMLNYTKQTSGVYSTAAKALLNHMIISKHITTTYDDKVRIDMAYKRISQRQETKLPRWPQKGDVEKMLAIVHTYNEESPRKERNIALLELLASSGARISEVINLDIKDVELVKLSAIVIGKGNHERWIYFNQTTASALTDYWKARKSMAPNDPVFGRHDRGAGKKVGRLTTTSARNIVKDIATIAGIDPSKFSPHYFRHAFAIRVLNETGDLALTQDLLGHKDPKVTREYAKIYDDDLQEAHRRIFK